MGTLIGHLLPGTFFISFSIWWMVSIFRKYFSSKMDLKSQRYENTATFTSQKCPNIPIEAYIKLLATIAGIIGETVTGFKWVDNQWKFANLMPNGHHIMMFSFFALNAIADLTTFYKVDCLPTDTDYITAIIAAGVECYLFANHLHGRQSLDVKLHTCLVIVILFCVIASVAEMLGNRNDARYGLFRSCCYLWQGTWFFQAGFILYPPKGFPIWNSDSMRTNMIMDLMFVGHLMFSIFVLIIIGLYVNFETRKNHRYSKIIQVNGEQEYHALISSQNSEVEESVEDYKANIT